MNTVPAGCPGRLQPSSKRKAGATDVQLGIELIGNPLTRDGSALVKVRVGSSFPLNGVLILLDEGVSSEEPVAPRVRRRSCRGRQAWLTIQADPA